MKKVESSYRFSVVETRIGLLLRGGLSSSDGLSSVDGLVSVDGLASVVGLFSMSNFFSSSSCLIFLSAASEKEFNEALRMS